MRMCAELPSSEQWHRVELQIDENPLKDIRREKDQYKTQSEKQSVGLQRKSAKTVVSLSKVRLLLGSDISCYMANNQHEICKG